LLSGTGEREPHRDDCSIVVLGAGPAGLAATVVVPPATVTTRPEMTALAGLTRSFAALLPPPRATTPGSNTGSPTRDADLPRVHPFIRGLDLDIHAATAALTMPYHNDRTEGVNTKTKNDQKADVRTRQLHPTPPPGPPQMRTRSVTTESAAEPLKLQP
jgi:hypothetical protein